MADKTFGVKVSEELHDKVRSMIDVSGISAKEWFEKAVALTEINEIKQGATDYKQDLTELEVHTTRIYELVTNMIQRSIYIKDHAVKEYADTLEQKEQMISDYQKKAAALTEEVKVANEAAEALETEKEELLKQFEELRSINTNNQLLIDEYKGKNDTLSGLVTKYQSFAVENEELKAKHAKNQEDWQSQMSQLTAQNREQEGKVQELTQRMDVMIRDHKVEVERLTEKKEFEKERALLEVEKEYQSKLIQANEAHNEKIKELYAEVSSVRKEYEEKILKLQEQLEKKKQKDK